MDLDTTAPLSELLNYLSLIEPGSIKELSTVKNIEELLAEQWNTFEASNELGMQGYKLLNRMQEVFWQPPLLSFSLERHGGTMMGSTRAEI